MSFSAVSILTVLGQWYRSYLWLCSRQPQKGCVLRQQNLLAACSEQTGKIRVASIRQALKFAQIPIPILADLLPWIALHWHQPVQNGVLTSNLMFSESTCFPNTWTHCDSAKVSWPKWAFPAFTMPGPPANIGVKPKTLTKPKYRWAEEAVVQKSSMQRNRHVQPHAG